jgi:uncharacterized protein YtpQ (UPF0354 family)
MSELEDVSSNSEVWDFIKDHPRMLGLPISDKQGLDLLSAMRDIYVELDVNIDSAKRMMTMLAGVLIASTQGEGDKIIEEVLVQEAMFNIDDNIKDILNEK